MAEASETVNKPFANIWELLKKRDEKHVSDLHKAAYENDEALLRACIADGQIDINMENDCGKTALYIAVEKKHKDIVHILLEHNAKVETESKSALFVAYDVDIIKLLDKKGTNLNWTDEFGNTPFLKSVQMANLEAMKYYLSKGADIMNVNSEGQTALHIGCNILPQEDIVDTLIKNGALINTKNKVGKTPLHLLSELSGNDMAQTTSVMKLLVKHGACTTVYDLKGYCPIHYLVENLYRTCEIGDDKYSLQIVHIFGDPEILKLKTSTGKSIIHLASENDIPETVFQYFLCKGCDVNAADRQGRTPLHNCPCGIRPLDTGKLLLSSGGDLNKRDRLGNTPLHIAADKGHQSLTNLFIMNGARVCAANDNEQEAIHFAAARGSFDIVRLLLDAGARCNTQDKNGSTPLHFAAWGNHARVTEFLIERGADYDKKDSLDETPRHTGLYAGSHGALEILSKYGNTFSPTSSQMFSNFADETLTFEKMQDLLNSDQAIQRLPNADVQTFLKSIFETPSVGAACKENEYFTVQREVETLMRNIANAISKLDERFSCSLLQAGSTSENTKVRSPNEFDFIFSLEKFPDICQPMYKTEIETPYVESSTGKEGRTLYDRLKDIKPQMRTSSIADYVHIRLIEGDKSEMFKDLTQESDLFQCQTISFRFCQLLEEALSSEDFPFSPCLVFNEITTHPALQLTWYGPRYKSLDISVDVVPAIALKDYPERFRLNSVLLTEDIRCIPAIVVPKLPTFMHTDLWRCSLALQETAIFRKLLPQVRNSYTVAKALLSSRVCPLVSFEEYEDEIAEYKKRNYIDESDDPENIVMYESPEEMLPSYVLKMCFLHAVEEKAEREGLENIYKSRETTDQGKDHKNLPIRYGPAEFVNESDFDLSDDVDVDLVFKIFHRCEELLQNAFVPSFFNPEHNVLGSKLLDEDLYKAQAFIQYIRKLLKLNEHDANS
ncbi:hypothetical protein FSP39_003973 [Pinctada imbricata]|uniref:Uncharacterized protein n=1 Tax=Pinctada imbricata TaxID=66713 RepID=A0AA89BVC8_PINIB|nr:hypothetical protein FSP39_003973 [Pinctada imbricata]